MIVGELLEYIGWGIPKEILTDQGTEFIAGMVKGVCKTLQIKHLRTSIYHPQTDGMTEHFNNILKSMLKKSIQGDPRRWDQLLTPLMFTIIEAPQASTVCSPFELEYCYQPGGLLDIIREGWKQQQQLRGVRIPRLVHPNW